MTTAWAVSKRVEGQQYRAIYYSHGLHGTVFRVRLARAAIALVPSQYPQQPRCSALFGSQNSLRDDRASRGRAE